MVKLLEVQNKALEASKGKNGFAFFLDMGLGKTLTALTEFDELTHDRSATRLVVVCPQSFKSGWVEEIQKHGFNFDSYIFNSGADFWSEKWLGKDFDKPPVLIVNYEAIRSAKVQDFIARFVTDRKSMIVFDESIQIKTYNSQQTKAALRMASWFTYQRILSGKPVTTGPHDLWAQMRAIGAIRDSYFPFKTTFCKMGGFKGKKVVGTQNEEILASKIDKYIFKASKEDWTDLPPKLYTTRQYQLTKTMLDQYRSMEHDFVLWLQSGEFVSVDTFITKYIKLAQIQSGFIIKEDGDIEELVAPVENPRFNLVHEIIEETQGKVVVVYFHKYTAQLLERALNEYNPAAIKGGMQPGEVQANKDRFNNDPYCRVILLQTRAGKYGHSLLGGSGVDSCSTVVFAENSYSLDDRSQLEDRIHRHGQKADNCLYVDLWGTELDRNIARALQTKEDIVKAVFRYFQSPVQ